VRRGYLNLDRVLLISLAKFLVAGTALGAGLWLTARYSAIYFAQLSAFRDETTLVLLTAVGLFIYGFSILVLFGRGWLFSLVRS
jgi:putative peptidoglycan lipid II flippase